MQLPHFNSLTLLCKKKTFFFLILKKGLFVFFFQILVKKCQIILLLNFGYDLISKSNKRLKHPKEGVNTSEAFPRGLGVDLW